MHVLLRPLFAFILHIGGFGLVILGVLDSSFFFLPFGNDLLLVVLVARHHGYLPLYVLAASLGSATGVLLLDLVCRKGGEEGLKKMVSARRINYLKKKMSQLAYVLGARAVRFTLIGLAAMTFGRRILRIAISPQFIWFIVGFSTLCIVGSALSILRWVRLSRSR